MTYVDVSIISVNGKTPQIDPSAFIAPGCRIIGDVVIGPDVSIWYNCVLRADVSRIVVGIGFRCDFIITFCDSTIDAVQLFVIHRLGDALQTHHVFIFRSTDEDHALGVTTHDADF